MKKIIVVILSVFFIFLNSGCARFMNEWDRDGSFIGSKRGDWIVIKYSGGKITDVYKLQNQMVQSEKKSDGWLFKDSHGNSVQAGGDIKALRINSGNSDLWNKYVEYHMEFSDGLSYFETIKK